jgi:succinyl-CoA synthetase beta subunit
MTLLEKIQLEEIQKLKARNLYVENELKQAKQIFQNLINDWEVKDAEVVEPNPLDNDFQSPIEQLGKIFKNMY